METSTRGLRADALDQAAPQTGADDAELAITRDLRASILHGLRWSTAIVVTTQAARSATSLVLVHLLAPRDFGLAGIALLFSGLVLAFSDLGLGDGLVQRHRITEEDRSTMFWTSAFVGTALTAAGIGLAAPLAAFFHEPRVRPLFMAVSVSFVLVALQTTPAALFQRTMSFRAITIRRIVSTVGGAAAGIAVAAGGGGAWALIVQAVTVCALSTILIWALSSWAPTFTYSLRSLKRLGTFGVTILGARMLDYVEGNADTVLVGRYLGASSLGLYSIAYSVILLPTQRLFVPLQDTFFPAFARIQHDRERMAALWLRLSRVVCAAVAPAMLGLFAVAPDFVTVVLGHRWAACTPVLRILSLVTLMQGFSAVAGRTLAALGKAGLVLRNSALRTALAVAAFAAGLHWGIVGVAAFYAGVTVPAQAYLVALVTRELAIKRLRYARSLAGVVQAAVAMFVGCILARSALAHLGVGPSFRLLTVICVGIAIYVPATVWRCPTVIAEIRNLRRRPRTSLSTATASS